MHQTLRVVLRTLPTRVFRAIGSFAFVFAFLLPAAADVPVIQSISIASTVPPRFYDAAPIDTNTIDTVFYNPTGIGAGQIDTITVTATDTQSNVDTATLTDTFFTVYTRSTRFSGHGDSIFAGHSK